MAEQQVWLITGASRSLGLHIAKSALKAGHKVIAGYRNKAKVGDAFAEVEALGGSWLQLDVASDDVEAKVQSVIDEYGRIDVLVNNAGYGLFGSIEETSVQQIEDIFKVNFTGSVRTMKAVLPSMRTRRSGTIVNLSSSLAVSAHGGFGPYSATKFALEGISESLQGEVAAFGIRVLVIEPGMMDTDFIDPAGTSILVPLTDLYKGTGVESSHTFLFAPGFLDTASRPAKVADRIVEAVDGTGAFANRKLSLMIPLGRECGWGMAKRAETLNHLVKDMAEVWETCYD
ncbi:putative short chain oxidoreductase/dehydrogenase [Hypoxylon trugodes]|uniref:putative short chain oxidoreductase/dehydrogenase n=1 Tax=Hypoxylon trugodes TaxID=326681 RepID=UPI00219DD3A9|nr:putative short chain oxidoreductase/dehydrogenase [Hypoxylon trugodes]KAI1393385.1 putative short chain oxidoreductase/dehydrogenase [Hypoxylon trugodes]